MTFTTYTIADISTAYLPKTDLPLLLQDGAPGHVANVDGEYGSIFCAFGDPDAYRDRIAESKAYGFSTEFCAILCELQKQKISYVRFDGAGLDVEGLEYHPDNRTTDSDTVENHCPECNEYESECTCDEV